MIVGLTGGIGSGKSVVAGIFEVLGCAVFNSDQAAKEVYFDDDIKLKVTTLLGSNSYLPDASLNKAYISSKIFNDANLLQALNQVIHPAVAERFKAFVNDNAGKIIIKETALLFEARLTAQVDKIILVIADENRRVARVMTRDAVSREDVMKRTGSQLLQEEKINRSDFIIDNNEEEFLTTQVLTILDQLKHA